MPQQHSLGLILLLCLSLCSETVSASPQPTPLTPTPQQKTQSNTSDSNRAAAEKAEAEARQLEKQNAPLSSQVIPKWEEALKYANSLDPEFKRKSLVAYEVLRDFSCADKLAAIKKPPKIDKSESSSNQPATPDFENNDIEKIKEQAQKWRRQENLTLEALSLLKLGLLPYQRIGEYEKALEVFQL